MSKACTLGIDFGTSNTAAGTYQNRGAHIFELEPGARTIPTAFFFDNSARKTLVGSTAVQALVDGVDGRFMRALKRVLGTSIMHEPRYILGRKVTFVDIIGQFLAEIRNRAEAEYEATFSHALSGRPVHFHDHDPDRDNQAEDDLKACYKAAGFDDVSFMLEPEAAALACDAAQSAQLRGLIVDIGGGTSDFSIFETDGRGDVSILASHGVRIGGTDFDRVLSIKYVMPLLGKGSLLRDEFGPGQKPAPKAIFNDLATWEQIPFLYTGKTKAMVSQMEKFAVEPQKLGRLGEVLTSELGHDLALLVEKGKISVNDLGQEAVVDLSLVEPGLSTDFTELGMADALKTLVATITGGVEETLRFANLKPASIDLVVYVGGSSLINLIPNAMRGLFPDAKHEFSEVFTAVVDGLAISSVHAPDR